jgi:hypothetical protein
LLPASKLLMAGMLVPQRSGELTLGHSTCGPELPQVLSEELGVLASCGGQFVPSPT